MRTPRRSRSDSPWLLFPSRFFPTRRFLSRCASSFGLGQCMRDSPRSTASSAWPRCAHCSPSATYASEVLLAVCGSAAEGGTTRAPLARGRSRPPCAPRWRTSPRPRRSRGAWVSGPGRRRLAAPRRSRSRSAGRASTPPRAPSASAPRPAPWRRARRRRRAALSLPAVTSATPRGASGMSTPRRARVRQVRQFKYANHFIQWFGCSALLRYAWNCMLLSRGYFLDLFTPQC